MVITLCFIKTSKTAAPDPQDDWQAIFDALWRLKRSWRNSPFPRSIRADLRTTARSDLTIIREAVAPLLLHIPYNKTGAVHNLIGLIRPEAAYIARYGAAFPEPARVGAYNTLINDDATAVVRKRTETAHKAKRTYRVKYKTARRETVRFFLTVVADTWVRELQDTETIYTKVAPKDPLSHLQAGCTGWHSLDLLALHNEMQSYHL